MSYIKSYADDILLHCTISYDRLRLFTERHWQPHETVQKWQFHFSFDKRKFLQVTNKLFPIITT